MVAGHLQEKKGYFYIVLSYSDISGKRKTKWIPTSLPVKGNKKKAEKLLMEARREFEPECKPIQDDVLFSDFMLQWLEILQAAKPIRRYIMGSNHSFIGGLGENYAALGENWHINFQSPSLKKAKRKAYKRHKTACRLNFFGAVGGIRTLVGLLPN